MVFAIQIEKSKVRKNEKNLAVFLPPIFPHKKQRKKPKPLRLAVRLAAVVARSAARLRSWPCSWPPKIFFGPKKKGGKVLYHKSNQNIPNSSCLIFFVNSKNFTNQKAAIQNCEAALAHQQKDGGLCRPSFGSIILAMRQINRQSHGKSL